ncbi:MAG: cytochrome b [Hyphomonadaceae bacterium]|nr:cytochrome b [Hyphomonadaceae bacterium]
MTSADTYSRTARWLHWTIALLIIFMLIGGKVMENIPREETSLRVFVYGWHKTFGIVILVLSFVRLFWRLGHKPPPLPAHMPAWERMAAMGTHAAFYIFMIAMPLIGWAITSTSRYPSKIFQVVPLPALPGLGDLGDKRAELHEFFENAHEKLAYLAMALIALHVAAALKHHYKDKDDVLARMIPRLKKDV